MRYASLVLAAALCLTAALPIASAHTIVGEYSGYLNYEHPFLFEDFTLKTLFEETNAESGDFMHGTFAYQSDAPRVPDEEVDPVLVERGWVVYEADYIRLQFGDTLFEETEGVEVGIVHDPFGIEVELFSVYGTRELDHPFYRPIGFVVYWPEMRSNAPPQSGDDINLDNEFAALIPMGSAARLLEPKFTLGPLPCDPDTLGDIDGDGNVAFSDFLILSDNFGNDVVNHELGDIDCDGSVQFSDFLTLSDNFGREVVSVPEPKYFSCCLFSLACLFSHLRCKHRRILKCTLEEPYLHS